MKNVRHQSKYMRLYKILNTAPNCTVQFLKGKVLTGAAVMQRAARDMFSFLLPFLEGKQLTLMHRLAV